MPKDTIQSDNLQQDTENNLIPAPNFTMIPNVIFDYWMKKLSHPTFKVLLCICRHTMGWNRRDTGISYKEIHLETKVARSTVQKAIEELIKKDLIFKVSGVRNLNNEVNTYHLKIVTPKCDVYRQAVKGFTEERYRGLPPGGTFKRKEKEKKNKEEYIYSCFGSHVKIKKEEYESLCEKHSKEFIDSIIEEVNDYCASKGKSYKDYAAAIRTFLRSKTGETNVISPKSAAPPPNNSIIQNLKLVQKCKKEYPDFFKDIRIFGKSHITSDDKKAKISGHDYASLDMNPDEFEKLLYKMARVENEKN
jgi:phage replication O-like protein O